MGDWLSIAWITVGIVLVIVLLFIIPILNEIRKIIKAYRVISERIEFATDVKSWINVVKFFKKEKHK